MSSNDGVWPWGECEHADQGAGRRWCSCGEWCFEPGSEAREMIRPDDAYWSLCRCCREPLYQLRIAELEELVKELANFREGVRYVHQVHWAPKTPPDDELLEWVRRDHVQAAIVQRLSNDVRAFQQCDGFEVFRAPDGESGLRECRKTHWHKEEKE